MEMLTAFGRNIEDLSYEELKAERRVQSWLYRKLKASYDRELATAEDASRLSEEDYQRLKAETKENYHKRRIDKAEYRFKMSRIEKEHLAANGVKLSFLDAYVKSLEAVIAEIDYYLDRRYEPYRHVESVFTRRHIRHRNKVKRKANIRENTNVYDFRKIVDRDTQLISWDKDKFMLIARDRGYQTDEGVLYAVGNELNLDRARTKVLIDKGRFSWGQVLCIGVMFEMTPKEFCDTFLSGYFVEQYGEFRASYDNIDKDELLKRAILPPKTADATSTEADAENED